MIQKIKHLLENVIEEILVGTLIAGCAIGSIAKEIKIRQPVPIERKLSEFRQGEIPGISEGDTFLLEKYVAPESEVAINKEDLELLTHMIYLEASGCSFKERVAVGYTAINRMNRWGKKDLGKIIKKPSQYSCFNNLNDNEIISKRELAKKKDYIVWEECEGIARGIVQNIYIDPTNGATHYYNPRIVKNPKWKMEGLEKIGKIKTEKGNSRHIFFREKYEEIVGGGS